MFASENQEQERGRKVGSRWGQPGNQGDFLVAVESLTVLVVVVDVVVVEVVVTTRAPLGWLFPQGKLNVEHRELPSVALGKTGKFKFLFASEWQPSTLASTRICMTCYLPTFEKKLWPHPLWSLIGWDGIRCGYFLTSLWNKNLQKPPLHVAGIPFTEKI